MSNFDTNLSMMEYVPGVSVGDIAELVEMLDVDHVDEIWPELNNFLTDSDEVRRMRGLVYVVL